MDERRQRIAEDLSGVLQGQLRCDDVTVAVYSVDAGIYQIEPLAVAFPADRDDVVSVVRYAAEQGIPVTPRGAGTGLAGQALGRGVVVDFSRFMHGIESIDADSVRVQPGVVHRELNRALKQHGRYFPPDPSNTAVTTIGGMIGVDSAGSRATRVGSTRDHVRELETVLADGSVARWEDEPLSVLRTAGQAGPQSNGSPSRRTILSRLAQLLAENADVIEQKQPPMIRNTCGYYLRRVLHDDTLHVPRLLAGSEGTLAITTEAVLHTAPLPAFRGVAIVLFGELESAAKAVQAVAGEQPSACDLLDRRVLSLARESDPRFAKLISPAAEAALLIEQTGYSERDVRERLRRTLDAVWSINLRAVTAAQAYGADDVEFLWSLPERVVPLLTRLTGKSRPQPFVEDVAVPPERLHEFLQSSQRVFQKHLLTASLYAHAASGQLHLRPFLPQPTPADGERLEALARDLYQCVFAVGGSISGEHGDGLSRTAFIRSQYGPLYPVFRQVKTIFDPHNRLNPGKIVSDDPHLTRRDIRPAVNPANLVDLKLQWSSEQLTDATLRCNSCGACRTQSNPLRMCPFFRLDQFESASPRAKATAVQAVLNGTLKQPLASAGMKQLADLCFNCKQCESECPSTVNIPQMMLEAKAQYVAVNGLGRTDWALSRVHSFGPVGSTASIAANWILRGPGGRWLMEKLLGIDRRRKLPLFARRSFLRSMDRRLRKPAKSNNDERPLVYFVGDYANYYDPQLAAAFVAVLQHNGIDVRVPPAQTVSGMAMISAGDIETAREVAEYNIRALAEPAREGCRIVCTEPTAALCLKHEYPAILDHPDVKLVASQVVEAGAVLEELHQAGRLRTDLAPLPHNAGYHLPCHLRALGETPESGSPLVRLLSLIPEFRVRRIEEGCSGMAGAFGMTRENFETSIRIGWNLIAKMRSGGFDFGVTECSSCKMQMEQGTTIPTVHPIKLLALSYGLMPEIRDKLKPSKHRLIVT